MNSRLICIAAITCALVGAKDPGTSATADEIWRELLIGNQRYTADKEVHPHQDSISRKQLASGQHPGAVILACADSRVPPEVIFDQGLGDLFVIRVAGNVIDNHILGSIEYAVEHLGSKLVVVLGHERCGAVTSAVHHDKVDGHIGSLMKSILPAVAASKHQEGDAVENAMRANVARVVHQIQHSHPVLDHLTKDHRIKVVGARYDLDSGLVEILP